MERAGLHARNAELAQPGAHLTCRPCREGDRQDPLGLVGAAEHAVGNAVGDSPGLAGPGAGQHAHGPAGRRRHLTLFGVKSVKNVVRRRAAAGSAG